MRSIDRIRRLASKAAVPGWFVLGGALIERLSTMQSATSLVKSIYGWLDKHQGAWFAIGIVMLSFAIVWPDLKAKLSGILPIRKTLPERVKAVEQGLAECFGASSRVLQLMDDSFSGVRRDVTANSDRWVAVIQELAGLRRQVADLTSAGNENEAQIVAINGRVDEHRPWITELERRIAVLEHRSHRNE